VQGGINTNVCAVSRPSTMCARRVTEWLRCLHGRVAGGLHPNLVMLVGGCVWFGVSSRRAGGGWARRRRNDETVVRLTSWARRRGGNREPLTANRLTYFHPFFFSLHFQNCLDHPTKNKFKKTNQECDADLLQRRLAWAKRCDVCNVAKNWGQVRVCLCVCV